MGKEEVVVVGSHVQGLFMRVSRFPMADETVLGWDYKEALDGGKGSHQAIACGRLGLPTHFVGRIGKDRIGEIGASWLKEAGVNLSYMARSETTATGCGFVMVNPEGIPAMTTAMGANGEFSTKDVDQARPILQRAKIVLITFEIPIKTALYAARVAKESGALTILTPGPAEPLPPDALKHVDLLIPNKGEAQTLLGDSFDQAEEPSCLATHLRQHFGLKRVVITLGGKGALVANGDDNYIVPALKVHVVDTPGAGDAFTAGLAFALYHNAPLLDAATFGCLAGARAITVRESVPGFGTLTELSQFAKDNHVVLPSSLAGSAPWSQLETRSST